MDRKTKKLIKEIQNTYGWYDLTLLSKRYWEEISGEKFKKRLTEGFIDRYAEYLDWQLVSEFQTLSEKLIEKYANKVYWDYISVYQKLSEPFMEKYADKLDWFYVSGNQELSAPFIEKHADKLDWYVLCAKHSFSPSFLIKNKDRINLKSLGGNKDFIKLFDYIDNYPEISIIIVNTLLEPVNINLRPKLYIEGIKKKVINNGFLNVYLNALKKEYPDKTVFELKFLDTFEKLSEVYNIEKKELINRIIQKEKISVPGK